MARSTTATFSLDGLDDDAYSLSLEHSFSLLSPSGSIATRDVEPATPSSARKFLDGPRATNSTSSMPPSAATLARSSSMSPSAATSGRSTYSWNAPDSPQTVALQSLGLTTSVEPALALLPTDSSIRPRMASPTSLKVSPSDSIASRDVEPPTPNSAKKFLDGPRSKSLMQNVALQSPDLIASVELARSLMPADSSIEQAFASVDQKSEGQPVQVAGAVVNFNSKQRGLMESNNLESSREDLFKAETVKKIAQEGVEVGISKEAAFAAADAKVVILAKKR